MFNMILPEIVVVSSEKSFADSFSWGVRRCGGRVSVCSTGAQLRAKIRRDKSIVVVLCQSKGTELDYWLWEVVRGKYCNPVIMLGYEGYASFCQKHLECRHYQGGHEYRPIPFLLFQDAPANIPSTPELTGLLKCAAEMTPLSEEERKCVVANFSSPAARLSVAAHSFARMDASQKLIILERLKDVLHAQGNLRVSAKVEIALEDLKRSGNLAEVDGVKKLIEGAAKHEAEQQSFR